MEGKTMREDKGMDFTGGKGGKEGGEHSKRAEVGDNGMVGNIEKRSMKWGTRARIQEDRYGRQRGGGRVGSQAGGGAGGEREMGRGRGGKRGRERGRECIEGRRWVKGRGGGGEKQAGEEIKFIRGERAGMGDGDRMRTR
ncbi:hypothetical protein Tco_1032272 [Tanacetum coccineum]|uniref:Uncharacterized protein n=1 Tax=Tanacetum coccineum TaxID=301880 RepID=A0ABQ5GCS8_9ASTR